MATATAAPDRKSREAYFTASQGELIWARFRRNRAAMVAGATFNLDAASAWQELHDTIFGAPPAPEQPDPSRA